MHNRDLMAPMTAFCYDLLGKGLKALEKRHKMLMKKAFKKKLTSAEQAELRKIVSTYNEAEKLKNRIWENHSLVTKVVQAKKP